MARPTIEGVNTNISGLMVRQLSSAAGQRAAAAPTGAPHVKRGSVRGPAVDAHDLQNAVLFVLALYASIAFLNAGTELSALTHHWQSFVEFIANGLFTP